MNYLVHYLKIFCAIQKSPNVKCDYLIIGGDFNLDLNLFKEKKKDILDQLSLKIIPYAPQRPGQRKHATRKTWSNVYFEDCKDKLDGLICDNILVHEATQVFFHFHKY